MVRSAGNARASRTMAAHAVPPGRHPSRRPASFDKCSGAGPSGRGSALNQSKSQCRDTRYALERDARRCHTPNEDILGDLKRAGLPVYAISNFSREKFDVALTKFPFLHTFDELIISGDVGMVKPNPEIFELLIQRRIARGEGRRFGPRSRSPQVAAEAISETLFSARAIESRQAQYGCRWCHRFNVGRRAARPCSAGRQATQQWILGQSLRPIFASSRGTVASIGDRRAGPAHGLSRRDATELQGGR
jgi:hypothetical protein